jgi:hypothetical protein
MRAKMLVTPRAPLALECHISNLVLNHIPHRYHSPILFFSISGPDAGMSWA